MMKHIKRLTALLCALLCIGAATLPTAAYSILLPPGGMLTFSQDFDDWGNTDWQDTPPVALGLYELNVREHGVYSEGDPRFSLGDGRLYFDNRGGGGDAYLSFVQLNDEYTKSIVMGKYTLQYDLCYLAATHPAATAALITEFGCEAQCYNGFFLRADGRADHACHFYGSWKRFSHYDPEVDLDPTAPADGSAGTPLIRKLLGTDTIGAYLYRRFGTLPPQDPTKQYFLDIPVTIRLQWDPEMGHRVYMKTDEMTEFVKVSEPSIHADGSMYVGWEGFAVALKIFDGMAGYIDNIQMWIGWDDAPSAEHKKYAAHQQSVKEDWDAYWKYVAQIERPSGR